MHRLLEAIEVQRVINATVAGTSDIAGSVVDMEGADGVLFIAALGTLTSGQVTKLKAQQGALANGGDLADIAGSETAAMADGDSNKLLVLDVFQPPMRYVTALVDRGTQNAVIDSVIAIVYRLRNLPSVQGSTVSQSKTIQNAACGTA